MKTQKFLTRPGRGPRGELGATLLEYAAMVTLVAFVALIAVANVGAYSTKPICEAMVGIKLDYEAQLLNNTAHFSPSGNSWVKEGVLLTCNVYYDSFSVDPLWGPGIVASRAG